MATALIVPMRPVVNALQQLERAGRTDQRQGTVDRVLAELRAGGSGFGVARELQAERLGHNPAGGIA